MPISKVVLDNQSKENVDLDGQFVRIPHGTTAQRPSSPVGGQLRFNTDLGTLEQYNTNTNAWAAIDSPPIISTLAYSGSNTATDPAGGETITLTGSNFKTGFTVTIGGTSAASTTFVNSTTVRFTTPAKTAGDYDVVFTNSNGLAATLTNGISVNGTPAFTTAAGSLGDVDGGLPISTITIVASEPDGGAVSYSITSNALPAGLSLASATGQITGTPTSPSSTTTTNFTVTATDDENQTNSRAFSLQVFRKVNNFNIPFSAEFNGTSKYLRKVGFPTASDSTRASFSFWAKFPSDQRDSINKRILACVTGTNAFNFIGWDNVHKFQYRTRNSSGNETMRFESDHRFNDTSAWYHVFVSVDFNQTGDAKVVAYLNGVLYDTWQSTSHVNSGTGFTNHNWFSGGSADFSICKNSVNNNSSNDQFSEALVAEVHVIDGQIKSYTDFGEFYNGVWVPKQYTGTYGNSGFHLDFADSSDFGKDVSGNGNHFTSYNMQAHNQVHDTPTNNFPYFDRRGSIQPQTQGVPTTTSQFVNRGRGWTVSSASAKHITHTLPTSGKWYWEWRVGGSNWYQYIVNEANERGSISATPYGSVNNDWTVYGIGSNNASTAVNCTLGSFTMSSNAAGDVFANRWDADAGVMEIYQNNSKIAEYNNFTIPGPYLIVYDRQTSSNTSVTHTTNFGQDSTFSGNETQTSNADANGIGEFHYAVPTGHLAICSANLPEAGAAQVVRDIRPEDHFDTLTWLGDAAASRAITGLQFSPDFLVIQNRSSTRSNRAYDTIRGTGKGLTFTDNVTEYTETNSILSFDSNGFTIGSKNNLNGSSEHICGWCWKAGGTPTATNVAGVGAVPTTGSVLIDGVASTAAVAGTSVVEKQSVNTKAQFSITHYSGSSGTDTVAHGLSGAPDFVIMKRFADPNSTNASWQVGVTGAMPLVGILNTADQFNNASSSYSGGGIGALNATTVQITSGSSNANNLNLNNSDNIMYAWKSVDGYSLFGTYHGNNNADGAFVNCGFKPAFVMVKCYTTGGSSSNYDWVVFDNKRNGTTIGATDDLRYNPIVAAMDWNEASQAEISNRNQIEFLSNGFKHVTSFGDTNSTQDYVFMAFAENPYKYARTQTG